MLDGTQWSLLVLFDNGYAYVSGGSNGFPESFDSVVARLSRLVVGKLLCPDTSA